MPFDRCLLLVVVMLISTCSSQTVRNTGCLPTITTVEGSFAPSGPLCSGQLIFDEPFDDLDPSIWKHENRMSANGEFQWYTQCERNTFTMDGILYITPTLTIDVIPDLSNCYIEIKDNCQQGICEHVCSEEHPAPPIQSGRIKTNGTFGFRYGRVEVRAIVPTGDWLFPAIWMMPTHNVYGNWPRSGEIDAMETMGNERLEYINGGSASVKDDSISMASTLHFGPDGQHSAWRTAHFVSELECRWCWHLYQLEWTPDHIEFRVDDKLLGTIATGDGYYKRGNFSGSNIWQEGLPDAPFDQSFHFILNLAVGGVSGFFGDDIKGKPWKNSSPYAQRDFWNAHDKWLPTWYSDQDEYRSSFKVDYVKAWAL